MRFFSSIVCFLRIIFLKNEWKSWWCVSLDGTPALCLNNSNFTHLILQGIILGCTLLPIRVFLAWILLIAAWIVAVPRLAGLSQEERSKPLSGWRRWLFHPILWLLGRAVFFCVGFHWVKVKGRKADVKEAPILVVAPHSSFLDMVIMFPAGVPSVVSRSENINLPVIGGEERDGICLLCHCLYTWKHLLDR